MSVKIIFTIPGMGIEDGTLAQWRKAIGDRVAQGEVIAEMETAKAIQEIEAPASGRLAAIFVRPGETVTVNAELGLIDANDA